MKRKITLAVSYVLIFSFAIQLLLGPSTVQAAESANATVETQINSLLNQLTKESESKGMYAGISVYNLTQKSWMYRHQADKAFVPASNMKVFTSAAALDQLGPEYRFKTEVYTDGNLNRNGVLKGNLILKGYGDPTLELEDLIKIATEIKAKEITSIEGNILVDESYFDETRLGPGWMWDDEVYGYSAQLSGLSLHQNAIDAIITPSTNAGELASISFLPDSDYLKVQANVTTTEGKDQKIKVVRELSTNNLTISGSIGKDAKAYTEEVTMEEPALYVGKTFSMLLKEQGVQISSNSQLQKTEWKKGKPIVTHYSKPMSSIVEELNKESDNYYAEALLKTMGATKKKEGSSQSGLQVVRSYMDEAKIKERYQQSDGSGLSRFNLITPNQMTELLIHIQSEPFKDVFEKSLPIAGIDGSLKNRMKGTAAETKLIAKTGSMSGVNTLSGYVTAQNGDKIAFSIMINGIYKSKYATDLQNAIGNILATYPTAATEEIAGSADHKSYKLSSLLDPLWEDPALSQLHVGMMVTSLDKQGEEAILYEHQADQWLTPGTVLKHLTTMAALTQLGENHQFSTELYASTSVNPNGTLYGDIILKGLGDPSSITDKQSTTNQLSALDQLVGQLKEKGIKQIEGNILVDDTYFDNEVRGLGWAWDEEENLPRVGALQSDNGFITLSFQPGKKVNSPVSFDMWPKTNYVTLYNEATTGKSGSPNTFAITKNRGTNIIRLIGSLSKDAFAQLEKVAVEDPAVFTGVLLMQKLKEAEISLAPKTKILEQTVPATAIKIGQVHSSSLRELIVEMNKEDNHLYAEMINKFVGKSKAGEGSAEKGISVIQNMLTSWGLSTEFDMMDASGVTRYNLISARQLNNALVKMASQPEYLSYYNSLPIAGVDGTLKNRFTNTPASSNLRALYSKTKNLTSISGYLTTKGNERLVVTLILNGDVADPQSLVRLEDRIMALLSTYE
ncbi:D-alanyl-D-alanine carboxypeptidase/D-alanyl-D-alanine endopeptidase [Brevibacillus daliensis]|uniref:D-alanyl-D-alanine carboxypeptidase/D-alanyl-D-alanine endopeptidase n=1 Tax=Brevibacillus daliensis TaxID=2892995 RepID=UPI001E2B5B5A|nr:D-alanyl-D-alanine carboxypeptidase/D-alanyl-D-alanine-endopeptidase [Brevibacillus daliensis]